MLQALFIFWHGGIVICHVLDSRWRQRESGCVFAAYHILVVRATQYISVKTKNIRGLIKNNFVV